MPRWWVDICRSFGPALAGVHHALRTQRNLRVHACCTCLALGLGGWLRLHRWEWCAVLLATGLVWTAEMLNSALEALADRVSLAREESIGRVKDMAAAAVLVAALTAATVGAVVFIPKLWP